MKIFDLLRRKILEKSKSAFVDIMSIIIKVLTHSFPMHPFSTPWKHGTIFNFSNKSEWRKVLIKTQAWCVENYGECIQSLQ